MLREILNYRLTNLDWAHVIVWCALLLAIAVLVTV